MNVDVLPSIDFNEIKAEFLKARAELVTVHAELYENQVNFLKTKARLSTATNRFYELQGKLFKAQQESDALGGKS